MAWIESHQELKNHPKTRHLARELGTSVPAVIGHLHCLWWWAMDYAPDGDLSRWEAADMGDAAMFDGDPDTLIEALINSGFVDENQGNLRLHDWDKYGEKLHRRRQVNAERMRQKRAEERMPEMACDARATHVQNTCIGTGHDSTGHDSTRHESPYNPPLSGGRPADIQRTSGCREEKMYKRRYIREDKITGNNMSESGDSVSSKTNSSSAEPKTNASKTLVRDLFDLYKLHIQAQARICPSDKIKARLKRFNPDEIRQAILNFSRDSWWMEHNGGRGAAWFFHSDDRLEQFLNLRPEPKRNGNSDASGNYFGGSPAEGLSETLPSAGEVEVDFEDAFA